MQAAVGSGGGLRAWGLLPFRQVVGEPWLVCLRPGLYMYMHVHASVPIYMYTHTHLLHVVYVCVFVSMHLYVHIILQGWQ